MTTLFVSDLHLDGTRPAVTHSFLNWLCAEASRSDALYILGDLFEAYVGDDDDAPWVAAVADRLRTVAERGVSIYLMHGNRDFLIGADFARRAGALLLPDLVKIDLYDVPTLLLHGDLLCLEDHAYQRLRRQWRDPAWQQQFLAQPLSARRAFAASARAESARHTSAMSPEVLDVTPAAVERMFDEHQARRMIHGHTHRPAVHGLDHGRERIVLGDWYEQGSVLRIDRDGPVLTVLPLDR